MPFRRTTVRRRRLDDTIGLTPGRVQIAFTGDTFLVEGFESDKAAQAFWDKHSTALMRWWFSGVPADFEGGFGFQPADSDRKPHALSRPAFWWRYDAPEKRRQIIAERRWRERPGTTFLDSYTVPATPEIVELCWRDGVGSFGLPRYGGLYIVETEADYLKRHGLLTPKEERLISKQPRTEKVRHAEREFSK